MEHSPSKILALIEMSVITIQIGQCGNQIGQAVFDHVYEDYKSTKPLCPKHINQEYSIKSRDIWFNKTLRDKLVARAILIDTESKVINESGYTNKHKRGYQFKNICVKSLGGSANNWAFGYSTNADCLSNLAIEQVRKLTEARDDNAVLISLLSSSGGTGSGVGCKILQRLRDEYPQKTLLNCVTLPFKSGEVVTQSYNTLLTLAKLYDVSDGIILLENDRLHNNVKSAQPNKEVSFEDLNTLIAHQVTSIIQPCDGLQLSTLVQDLTHSQHKLLQLRSGPNVVQEEHLKFESELPWTPILREILKPLAIEFISLDKEKPIRPKSLGLALITRGGKPPSSEQLKPLKDGVCSVDWIEQDSKLRHYHQLRNFHNMNKFATVLTNNSNVCNALNLMLDDAWNLFTHGVYLHHYKTHGVDDQYFLESFQKMENILAAYQNL